MARSSEVWPWLQEKHGLAAPDRATRRSNRGFTVLGSYLLAIAVYAAGLACDKKSEQQKSDNQTFPVEHLGRFYQAGGWMEMDQHQKAADIYQELLKAGVADPAVRANLAASLIGVQRFEEAQTHAEMAAEAAPENPDVGLIHAAVLEARGQREASLKLLESLAAAHPDHVAARYALISALQNLGDDGRLGEIASQYDELLKHAPRNLAALLAAARVQAQAGRIEAAETCFNRALAVVGEPPASLAPIVEQFEQAAAKGDAAGLARGAMIAANLLRQTERFRSDMLALGPAQGAVPRAVKHPVWPLSGEAPKAIAAKVQFEKATERLGLKPLAEDGTVRGVVVGTVLADRSPAIYAIRANGAGRLFVRDAGLYRDVTADMGLGSAPPCESALFVDLNNDRRMDLLLSCPQGDRVYRSGDDGRIGDATSASGLSDQPGSRGAAPFDFDLDGDLDLLRWDEKRLHVHRNDGEGTLSAVEGLFGLPNDVEGIRSILARDFDDDGDIDLCVTEGPSTVGPRMFSNERLATFREIPLEFGSNSAWGDAEPIIADFDNDGWLEIAEVAGGQRWEVGPDFEIKAAAGEPRPAGTPAATEGTPAATMSTREDSLGNTCVAIADAVADFDCDGRLDLVRVYSDGSTDRPDVRVKPGAGLLAVDLDGDGLVDLLSTSGEAFINKTAGAGNWLNVALVALIQGDSRFNAFGIGSTIEVRAGGLYQKRHVAGATTHFGLGPYRHADVLRVVWPNGNYQNLEFRASDKMQLAANQTIVEEQSLKGSCPYLYAWNGERFEFVTDVLWRSALGMSIMSGVIGHHGPADDYFKIDGERLRPHGGEYVLQFTEELWETAYFDYCRLFVVDHPPDTEIFVDERCTSPPYPRFEIVKVREARPIRSAIDHAGQDVTELLSHRLLAGATRVDHRLTAGDAGNGRYVRGFGLTRYQGIVEDHDLILDLGPFAAEDEVRLFLHGWLWPTDASTNVAVSQNPTLRARPPVLTLIGADGAWRQTDVPVGFPSGKNKTLVLDLTGRFATDDHRVKLSTNFAIFWDHVFCTVGPQEFETKVTELPVAAAELRYRGFSYAYPRVPHGPTIPEYEALDLSTQWRDLVGAYTRFGDVTELLTALDSMYTIVGAGDEVTLRFDAGRAPALPPGWRRDFIIHTDGWLKDGDLNSASGKTVEPLPFHGMTRYPYGEDQSYPDSPEHRRYRTTYNTRQRGQEAFRSHLRP